MKLIIKNQNGFTLTEILIALVIFTIGILGVATMQTTSLKGNSTSRQISEASNIAADRIETILSLDYSDSLLADDDGDGTGQDINGAGVDDDGGNFGLDDATDTTADHDELSYDGNYHLFWNVAVDHPLSNTKTIKIIVETPGAARNIEMTYLKTDAL